jgi:hypothetical protein
MDELARKKELIKEMTATELALPVVQKELAVHTYNKVPFSRIAALGTGLEPVAAAVQQVVQGGQAVSGYYKVTIPAGTHLASFKDGTGFLGTAMGDTGIAGQARLNPLVCDPTMLLVAATLANIDKKLDAIQETQQEMLDFIVQKEKSALKGDLDFLMDIYNNYKHNWNNEKYKTANHIKVLDIRQNASRMIDFYREQIKKHISKKAFLHSDQDVKKQLTKVQDEFKEYQLALYLYGFGYFLEILLQENFDATYLEAVSAKVENLSFQYRELYSVTYNQIEAYTKSSLQSKLVGGLSKLNKTAGKAIAKIPIISKSQIDETLIRAGGNLETYKEKKVTATMRKLVDRQCSSIRPFIDNINMVNRMYNQPMTLIFNEENLYLATTGTV